MIRILHTVHFYSIMAIILCVIALTLTYIFNSDSMFNVAAYTLMGFMIINATSKGIADFITIRKNKSTSK